MSINQSVVASVDDVHPLAGDDPTEPTQPVRRSRFGSLWQQVLAAVIIGIALGEWFPNTGAALKPLGDSFVTLTEWRSRRSSSERFSSASPAWAIFMRSGGSEPGRA